ncbi:hypothetical protein M33023_01160 [Candidatus Phytoplasma asteris]|uniref:Uncharacterized protein n=1 Tax=Candidatus Phytoplasma asteris TaxID=85620 RepID=A0ABZ2YEG6_9MOLU
MVEKGFWKVEKYGHFGFKVIFYDGTYEDLISNNKEIIYISDNKNSLYTDGLYLQFEKDFNYPHFYIL